MKLSKLSSIALITLMMIVHSAFSQGTATRNIDPFDEILAFGQVEVHIVEGEHGTLKIEAENLGIDKIITNVSGQQLTIKLQPGIYAKKNQLAKVFVSAPTVRVLKVQAGAKVFSDQAIEGDKIVISARSGAKVNLEVAVNVLEVRSTEGARLELSGTTGSIEGTANNGGFLDAQHLVAKTAFFKSQIGGVAKVRATHRLKAIARTGGKLVHYGDPEEKDIQATLGGSIECVCGG